MMEDNCVVCNLPFEEGDGRFNYPKGARCINCGNAVNSLLDEIEHLLNRYAEATGFKPRIRYR